MNVGKMITEAMREQRKRDWIRGMCGDWGCEHINRLKTYVWWGWHINGHGGIGKPGSET